MFFFCFKAPNSDLWHIRRTALNIIYQHKKRRLIKIDTFVKSGRKNAVKRTEEAPRRSVKVSRSRGLSVKEVEESRALFGGNVITKGRRTSFFKRFLMNLSDPIIRILIGAMVINIIFMFKNINIPETVGIAAAVFIAAFVSTVSEHGSEAAFDKLSEESRKSVYTVMRDGKWAELDEREIVCGDIIIIGKGSFIPADAILISGEISVNQAPLTGESAEIKKAAGVGSSAYYTVCDSMSLSLSDSTQIFKGCLCTKGEATAVVCRVGDSTFYGGVAKNLQKDSRPSPLKTRLSQLATSISYIGYIAAGMIMAAYLFNVFVIDSRWVASEITSKLSDIRFVASSIISAVTLGVSVIVVAVPEGLPMMITVVLSSNMKKMLKSGVLVRKMVGIETAGSMNILFTDKTGTLTSGNMSVSRVIMPHGSFDSIKSLSSDPAAACRLPVICTGLCADGQKTPTERAVIAFFKAHSQKGKAQIEKKLAFNSVNKYSACLAASGGRRFCSVMGAGEKLLERCSYCLSPSGQMRILDHDTKRRLSDAIYRETASSARVLAIVETDAAKWDEVQNDRFGGACLVMLISIKDQLRHDIRHAVSDAKGAGVHVVMITGDNRETAAAVAADAGIIDKTHSLVLTGEEMGKMNDRALADALPSLAVVARALPSDKLRLVELAGKLGLVSGMTGDGVNDAPSLKAADVGFAMGSGSDVAKEASDIILTNDSFKSITNAILYGRTVFESIRKFIIFQLTMNLAALGVSLLGPFIGVETPITVIQMLWVNIIMDTLGGLAFAGEVPLMEYMRRNPIKQSEKILTSSMVSQILFCGIYTLAVCLVFLKAPFIKEMLLRSDEKYFMTCFFALFIFCGVFNSFNARAPRGRLLSHIGGNKAFIAIIAFVAVAQLAIIYFGGEIFRAVPLYSRDLALTALFALSVIPVNSLHKLSKKVRSGKSAR